MAQMLREDSGGGGASTFRMTLISLARVIGYLKFAVPESNPGGHRIGFASYTRIFEELCRQYFPHEHLDRPLCSSSYGPACEAAWGPRHAGRRDYRLFASVVGTGPDRHIYQYLVDDRTILAAPFAELDLQWASKDFVAATMDRDKRDLFLARLGHAMHGIEDFFAHSNFTEHAVLAAGGRAGMATALKRRAVRRVGEPPDDAVPAASRTRSPAGCAGTRLEHETEAAGLGEPEPLVATGYFDGIQD